MFDYDTLDTTFEAMSKQSAGLIVASPPLRGLVPPELLRLSTLECLPASKWIAKYRHSAQARCRLVCVFGAGMSALSFSDWNSFVFEHYPALELLLLELPGHGSHIPEAALSDAADVAKRATEVFLSLNTRAGEDGSTPFALFGFSAGASVVPLLAAELAEAGHQAVAVYVGGRAGPQVVYEPPGSAGPEDVREYLRWFAGLFMSAPSSERLERLIVTAPDSKLLDRVAALFRSGLLLGNSVAATSKSSKSLSASAVRPLTCDIHVIASHADDVWPAGSTNSSATRGCYIPDYLDIVETWRSWTHGSVTGTAFHEVRHHELCSERLLGLICDDLQLRLLDMA